MKKKKKKNHNNLVCPFCGNVLHNLPAELEIKYIIKFAKWITEKFKEYEKE